MDIKDWIAEILNPIRTLENLHLLLERQDVISFPIRRQYIRLTYPEPMMGAVPVTRLEFGSFGEYVDLLRDRRYTALLYDGSFLQISIDISRGDIVGHRYCYYPCPVQFRDDDLRLFSEEESIVNVVEAFLDQPNLLLLRTPVRIDFNSDEWREGEPHAHIHLNHTDCRCALSGAIYPGYFIKFIIRYFYPNIWQRYVVLHSLSQDISGYWLKNKEKQFLHFTSVKPFQ